MKNPCIINSDFDSAQSNGLTYFSLKFFKGQGCCQKLVFSTLQFVFLLMVKCDVT